MEPGDIATILQILQAHPWLGALVVVVAAAAGAAWKVASTYLERFLERRKSARSERPNIRQHPFFSAANHAIRSRVRGLDIAEPFRAKVFKDFLVIKFSAWLTETEALVERVLTSAAMSQEEFHALMVAYVDRLVETYEFQARAQGIPDQVVERFSVWYRPSVETVYAFLQRVSDSRWYSSPEDRLYAVLSFMTSMIDHTLVDAEAMLVGLNGELDGIRYAGLISHCKKGDRCSVCTNPARLHPPEDAHDAPKDRQV